MYYISLVLCFTSQLHYSDVQVYDSGDWGTVCSHGWTEDAAAVACQQLGFVLNPEDWLLLPGDLPSEGIDARIVRGYAEYMPQKIFCMLIMM